MKPFDLLDAPLDGVNLIEAGAGTGKTYNIEGLFVRLILETQLQVDQYRAFALYKTDHKSNADSIQISRNGCALQNCITVLQKSYRFSAASGIGGLSRAVNGGDDKAAPACLTDPAETTIAWRAVPSGEHLMRDIGRKIVDGYRKYLTLTDPMLAIAEFARFKILRALKIGPSGAVAINRPAENVLSREGLIAFDGREMPLWYWGRPVLITQNDYNL